MGLFGTHKDKKKHKTTPHITNKPLFHLRSAHCAIAGLALKLHLLLLKACSCVKRTLSGLSGFSTDSDNADTCVNSLRTLAVHHKHDYPPAVREGSLFESFTPNYLQKSE